MNHNIPIAFGRTSSFFNNEKNKNEKGREEQEKEFNSAVSFSDLAPCFSKRGSSFHWERVLCWFPYFMTT